MISLSLHRYYIAVTQLTILILCLRVIVCLIRLDNTYILLLEPEESKGGGKIRSKRTAVEEARCCYRRLISSGYSPDRVESSG